MTINGKANMIPRKDGDMPRILLVDDDSRFIVTIRNQLQKCGYKVSFLTRSDYVLKRLTGEAYDLVLLDINLPGTDGIEVFKQMKADADLSLIPVIFISVEQDEQVFSKCFELGAADFIVKPINSIVLQARIKSVISSGVYKKKLQANIQLQDEMIEELHRATRHLKNANDKIEQQNQELETRVDQRTRQLEDAKNEAELISRYNQSIIQNSPDGIGFLTPEGDIIDCNQAFEDTFQLQNSKVIGKNIRSFCIPEDQDNWDAWWGPIKQGKAVRYETFNLRQDGTRFPVSVSAAAVSGSEEVQNGIIYTVRDQSIFKKTEAALEEQLKEAALLNKELEQTNKGIIALWREIEEKNEALQGQNIQLKKQEQLLQGLVEVKNCLLTEADLLKAMGKVSESIGRTADMDRVDIFEIIADRQSPGKEIKLRISWDQRLGVSDKNPVASRSITDQDTEFNQWYRKLVDGQSISICRKDLSGWTLRYVEEHELSSLMCVPILTWKNTWGIVCYKKEHNYTWSTAEGSMLDSIAESISRIFERQRAEEENKKYQEELIRNQTLLQDIDLARKLRDVVVGKTPMVDKRFTFFKKFRSVGEGGGDCSSFRIHRINDDKMIICSLTDQVGHGVEGVLKSILFEYLLRLPGTCLDNNGRLKSAAEQLEIMNQEVMKLSDVPGSSACTAQLLIIDYDSLKLIYASAGHHPAVLVRADGEVVELDGTGMHIGYLPDANYIQNEVQLSPGDKVIQFTDGLFEIFRSHDEWFGYTSILDTIKEHSLQSISRIYEAVMQRLSGFTGIDMLRYMDGVETTGHQIRQLDDILVTGIEVDALPYKKIVISSPVSIPELDTLKEELCRLAERNGFSEKNINNIRTAVHEAVVNACEHGNRNAPDKQVFIKYAFLDQPQKELIIEFMDEGEGFQTDEVLSRPGQGDLSIRGRGVHWIRSMSSEFEYNHSGNMLTLHFNQ